jgi:hypothetical protein
MAVMGADLKLKQKQAFWETPWNLVVIISAIAAATAAIAGLAGYKLVQGSLPVPVQVIFQPGSIVVPSSPAK